MTREQTEMTQTEIELRAELEQAKAEIIEQCRLNGMGAEREAKLMAQLEQAKAENEKLRNAVRSVNSQAEEFERRWYLATHALEQAEAENERLLAEVERLKWAINPSQKPWTPSQSNKCLVCGQDHGGLMCPQLIVTCRSPSPTQGDV